MIFFNRIKRYAHNIAFMGLFGVGLVSCADYLDVVPEEQASLRDAVKNFETTRQFMYSCYGGVHNPYNYSGIEAASDEFVLPPLWREGMHSILYGLNTPLSVVEDRWSGNFWRYVGQCHLFLQELPKANGVSDQQKKDFKAQAEFLRAYYHMQALFLYGPIPIIDRLYPDSTPQSQYPGRSHFDYAVKWIADEFDRVAQDLPASRTGDDMGLATSVMAKALKARMLVYAASPLWNGSFPFPEWKNKNYETPGYGKELVSLRYDNTKWERAKVACEEALAAATAAGHQLFREYPSEADVGLPYVPGNVDDAFKKKVLLMRYVVTTRYQQNKEIIWGLATQGNWLLGAIPHYVLTRNDGVSFGYYSGISPVLNTSIHYFYTNKGKRPADDATFTSEGEWYKSAGISGREDIIRLNVGREPRFYAWFAFDGGDYGSRIKNGKPLRVELRKTDAQGFNPDKYNRDNNATGYFTQKFLPPNSFMTPSGSFSNESKPRSLIRMAELYLNLAECYAALNEQAGTFENLNIIRERAGVPALTAADVTSDNTLMDWVRNERFIELWGEGHRYYDIRRWRIADKTMRAGFREALNAYGIKNPTFEQFNTVVPIQQNFRWLDRMYLHPIERNEAYRNLQMMQAPGY